MGAMWAMPGPLWVRMAVRLTAYAGALTAVIAHQTQLAEDPPVAIAGSPGSVAPPVSRRDAVLVPATREGIAASELAPFISWGHG